MQNGCVFIKETDHGTSKFYQYFCRLDSDVTNVPDLFDKECWQSLTDFAIPDPVDNSPDNLHFTDQCTEIGVINQPAKHVGK